MDPDETWKKIYQALQQANLGDCEFDFLEDVLEAADAMLGWMNKSGFMPRGDGAPSHPKVLRNILLGLCLQIERLTGEQPWRTSVADRWVSNPEAFYAEYLGKPFDVEI